MLIRHITFDCANAFELATFWSAATGWPISTDDKPGDTEVEIGTPDGTGDLLFIEVPEGKTVKNRVHLDWSPTQRTRDEEVEHLLGVGATIHEDHRRPDGLGWVTMLDPEGNEFCVVRSVSERT